MKYYKPDELRAGMRLAKQIYNKQGVLLYKRGFVLTDQIIASIQKFGLLGVLVLEPAEPLPPVSEEELEFDQYQTTWMFRLRDSLISISKGRKPEDLPALVHDIMRRFYSLNHAIVFSPTIRSSEDYTYKHSICTAILCAMLAHGMGFPDNAARSLVTAALLSDFGYLYVPKDIMSKPENELSTIDLLTIEQYRNKAAGMLKRGDATYGLDDSIFFILDEFIQVERKENSQLDISDFHMHTKILMVADKYDRMTAMSLGYEPVSPIQALRHLQGNKKLYEPTVVQALCDALSILPTGQCVELSSNRYGMILSETPGDQFHPQVLDFATNTVYDLSDPKLRNVIKIENLMPSMDQRYPFDAQSLKYFAPDPTLQSTTRRIRMRLEKARKREAAKHTHVNLA